MERKTFKQKWNEVDEVCPNCNQVTKVNTGLTKQNLGKLFRKPSSQDWIIFIMIILTIFGGWTYQNELKQYKEVVENPQELCQIYFESITSGYPYDFETFDDQEIKIIEND